MVWCAARITVAHATTAVRGLRLEYATIAYHVMIAYNTHHRTTARRTADMDNFDFDFAIKHWRAYVERQFGAVDGDEIAENVFNEGVALINAEPEFWAERGWPRMWDHIAQLPVVDVRANAPVWVDADGNPHYEGK